MPKLTDTQLVILSAAAGREDGAALPPPSSLKIRGGALTSTLQGLRKKGLLEEKPGTREAPAWRHGKDGRPMMLIITAAGRQAIDGEAGEGSAEQPSRRAAPAKVRRAEPKRAAPTGGKNPARQGTKQALLIDLLARKTGATIGEIVDATGWQAHSVRGAISGTLKKKHSHVAGSPIVPTDIRNPIVRLLPQSGRHLATS